ncbi:MAG TPA: DUF4097 family beta strand repeat-containing protein [Candidatus Baltobacteraceae bacterium]|jgi:hypothetical protein|nr:DUF4097 family beta strand repeat-containing protein [Candidatus Baltobacteraceae bacterium]
MKKAAVFCIGALLTGCASTMNYGGDAIHEQNHQTVPARGITSVHVLNVSGPITVKTTQGASITIDSTKSANDTDAIHRTHVTIHQEGPQLVVHTEYDQGGGWFGSHNGASVAYVVSIPRNLSLNVDNVSGPVTVSGTVGDLNVREVSGSVHAALGTVRPKQRINIQSVSGSVTLSIARNSDVRVQTKSISGAVNAFFPANIDKGFLGQMLDGRLGKGDGSIVIGAVSGGITISPQ